MILKKSLICFQKSAKNGFCRKGWGPENFTVLNFFLFFYAFPYPIFAICVFVSTLIKCVECSAAEEYDEGLSLIGMYFL